MQERLREILDDLYYHQKSMDRERAESQILQLFRDEMPKKMDTSLEECYGYLYKNGYSNGWDDCIDEMLKKMEGT